MKQSIIAMKVTVLHKKVQCLLTLVSGSVTILLQIRVDYSEIALWASALAKSLLIFCKSVGSFYNITR